MPGSPNTDQVASSARKFHCIATGQEHGSSRAQRTDRPPNVMPTLLLILGMNPLSTITIVRGKTSTPSSLCPSLNGPPNPMSPCGSASTVVGMIARRLDDRLVRPRRPTRRARSRRVIPAATTVFRMGAFCTRANLSAKRIGATVKPPYDRDSKVRMARSIRGDRRKRMSLFCHDHVAFTVKDLAVNRAFYEYLGGRVVSRPSPGFMEIVLGEIRLHLIPDAGATTRQPRSPRIDHLCLRRIARRPQHGRGANQCASAARRRAPMRGRRLPAPRRRRQGPLRRATAAQDFVLRGSGRDPPRSPRVLLGGKPRQAAAEYRRKFADLSRQAPYRVACHQKKK